MSDLVIFGIGLLVFFVTVYGTVVAGGVRLTRRQLTDDPSLTEDVTDEELDSTLLADVEY
jgi:hypothetical protein